MLQIVHQRPEAVPPLSTLSILSTLSTLSTSDLKRTQGISGNSEYTIKMGIPQTVKICKKCQECKSSASTRTNFWACYLNFDYQNLYQQLGNSPKRNAQKMHNIQILLPSFAFRYFLGCSGVDFLIFSIPATAL